MSYTKSFESYSDVKGLYYLVDPQTVKKRHRLIDLWIKHFGQESYQIISSNLVPLEVLEKSGHLADFKDQIFKIEGVSLALRPETGQGTFPNLKTIRHQLKGMPLKLWCVGSAFRNEKSTRDGKLRRNEFEQIQLHVLSSKNYDFFKQELDQIKDFFKSLNMQIELRQIEQKPHYSNRTIDIYHKNIEIGCINDRGQHDLYSFSEKERENLKLSELSIGLDRIIELGVF